METLQLKITGIKPAADDSILVELQEVNHQHIYYEAGQFLTFIIHHYGREVRRSYSITTTPGIDKEIAVLIKRQVNGEISRYLFEHLTIGNILTALPPAGRFTINTAETNRRTVFFIAAGSGISPVYSLLKKLLYSEPLSRAILIYQNRDEAGVIFNKELKELELKFSTQFVYLKLLSTPTKKDRLPQRLNNHLLEQLIIPYYSEGSPADFFICGPTAFMRMAQFVIRLLGVREVSIHKEHFVIDPAPGAPLITDRSPKLITLRWKGSLFQFTATYPVNILQSALNNNINLPYSCRGGRCSTCTIKCLSGKVSLSVNEVLTDRDLQNGLILTCVGYAETDLELEL